MENGSKSETTKNANRAIVEGQEGNNSFSGVGFQIAVSNHIDGVLSVEAMHEKTGRVGEGVSDSRKGPGPL